ncbi:MAG: fluoride efflux transporter CrcB [Bacteroidota bacterium]|nr:fluoride efflux transporter CrcB [Bacteroidota bacterium]
MIKNLLFVALGGGLGSMIRYTCQKWIYEIYPHTFPLGTFMVNLSGCFLIGIFYAIAEKSSVLTPEWRLLLTTGLCGGFTTFSAFAFENLTLLRSGDISYFLLYTGASVILGIAAVFAGIAFIKLI